MVLAGTVPTSHGSEMKNPRNGDAGGVMLLCENGKLRHTYDQLLHGAGEMKKGKRGLFIDNSEKPLSLHEENVYLKEMIKWEQARTMKIGARVADFVPLISLAMATDAEVERALPKLVKALTLAGHNIVCAEHLSDRRLYSLIVNGVLPFQAKVLPKGMFTEWFCCFHSETTALDPDDFSIYFQYYAEDFERDFWNRDEAVPTKIATPYPRPYLPKHRPIFSL